MPTLDLAFVRQQFPAFNEPSLQHTIFFENAGGSFMAEPVLSRLTTYFRRLKVQPYYPNPVSTEAGEWMTASYTALAQWMNTDASHIYFGPSTSQNTSVLSQAVLGWLKAGDAIVVSQQDHEANIGVWEKLEQAGITIKPWQVTPETGSLDLTALDGLLTPDVKLLTFSHCSNILGEINPVKAVCDIAKRKQVKTIVDGVSFAGHGLPDIGELGADIYLFSLYKVFGPHLGVMVIQPDMATLLCNQSHFFNAEIREKRLYPAGPDHAQVAAVNGVSEYFEALYQHHFAHQKAESDADKAQAVRLLIRESENALITPLLAFFNEHPAITIIGPNTVENKAPTIAIHIEGHHPKALAEALGKQNIMCGAGHFYSYRLLKAMGIPTDEGLLRFSLVHYNSHEEVEMVISALKDLLK